MLPHLRERPLNLQRFPNGAGAPGFWQKDIPATAPAWLRRWHETASTGAPDRDANDHLIADRVATLAWLGNQASFEIHAWTGRLPEPWRPTFALIDIDPGDVHDLGRDPGHRPAVPDGARASRRPRAIRRPPASAASRSGSRSSPRYAFAETSGWVERISRAVGAMVPDLVSWEWAKGARGGTGPARLHPERLASRRWSPRMPSVRRPARRCPRRSPGTSSTIPDLRPDRWTIRTIVDRVAEAAICSPPPRPTPRLPRNEPSVRRQQPGNIGKSGHQVATVQFDLAHVTPEGA